MKNHTSYLRKFSSIILSILLSSTLASQEFIEVTGEINEDVTWSHDIIKVTGDITVTNNATLTIAPGTRVEFQGKHVLTIESKMIAAGEPDDKIVFTCHPDNTSTGWNGIKFVETIDSSIVDYCHFEYTNSISSTQFGAIRIAQNSKLSVTNSTFDNTSGSHTNGIHCKDHANIVIKGNSFTNALSSSSSIYCYNSDPLIEDNTFITVYKSINLFQSDPVIRNNIIYDNSSDAITCSSSHPYLIGNVICNNFYSLDVVNSNPTFANNTICNNNQGINCRGNAKPVFYNNIIRGNYQYQVRRADNESQPDFYYCNIESGLAGVEGDDPYLGTYENNVDVDPMFNFPSSGYGTGNYDPDADWSLQTGSPMVNSGTPDVYGLKLPEKDAFMNPRISKGRIDIGAIEFHIDRMSVCGPITTNTTWWADTVAVGCDIVINDDVSLNLLPGTLIDFQGHYGIQVNGRIIAEGSESEPILFTSLDTLGFTDVANVNGGWKTILFNNAGNILSDNDSSILRHCIFKFSKTIEEDPEWFRGVVSVQYFSRLVIDHCSFINNYGAGVETKGGNLTISDSRFIDNFSDVGAVYLQYSTNSVIKNNQFIRNRIGLPGSKNHAGGLWVHFSKATLLNNSFLNNSGGFGGAVHFDASDNCLIMNNLFCNNEAGNGAGIASTESHGSKYINNTIANNNAYLGGGIYLRDSHIELYNTIIWGNLPEQIYQDTPGLPLDIYNSSIDGGVEGIKVYGDPEQILGMMSNVLDEDPYFKNPTSGAGYMFEDPGADWSMLPVSNSINNGTNDIQDIILPGTDLADNPRIHDEMIDIGAYENQDIPPIMVRQPSNQFKCEGENVILSVLVSDTVFYQWQKDGIDIPGAIKANLEINDLSGNHSGNYLCKIDNVYSSLESNPAYLFVTEKPKILTQPLDKWAETSKSASLNVFSKGSNLDYQWRKNGLDLPGANAPTLTILDSQIQDEGEYSCVVSNSCGTETSLDASLYLAPQICMVTVDPSTGNNMVIWEKASIAPIDTYNIYRESQAAGIYDLMGIKSKDELSVFIDSSADPTVQSYLYKITGIDETGTETDLDLCLAHKTIHLLVSTNPELQTTQLEWDRYRGFEYQTYAIYRSATGAGFTPIHYMASSHNSWTDPTPLVDVGFYRLAAQKPDPCYPAGAGKKAESGPYSHSLSNIEDNRLQAGESPPDTVILNNRNINTNNIVGALVGRFLAFDADSLDTHVFNLVQGEGDDDNFSFTILGDLLLAAEIFDFDVQDQYSIRVRCKDDGNLIREQVFIVNIYGPSGIIQPIADKIQCYPNPFSESTIILFNNPEGQSYSLYIADMSGKICRVVNNISSSEYMLDRGNLANGFYILELRGPKTLRGKILIE